MGIFSWRPSTTAKPAPGIEFPDDVVAAALQCYVSGLDVGGLTGGTGSVYRFTVHGTSFRPEALDWVSEQPRPWRRPNDANIPAVCVREPSNAFDANAIQVVVDGIHIGFLPRAEAKIWQAVLREVERRGLLLVGSVRLLPDAGRGLGAAVYLRDSLPGFVGPLTKERDEAARRVSEGMVPAALNDEARDRLVADLRQLVRENAVRDKRRGGYVAKRGRSAVLRARRHLAALKEAGTSSEVNQVEPLVDQLDDDIDWLLEAEDADEREDAHLAVQLDCEELAEALLMPGT